MDSFYLSSLLDYYVDPNVSPQLHHSPKTDHDQNETEDSISRAEHKKLIRRQRALHMNVNKHEQHKNRRRNAAHRMQKDPFYDQLRSAYIDCPDSVNIALQTLLDDHDSIYPHWNDLQSGTVGSFNDSDVSSDSEQEQDNCMECGVMSATVQFLPCGHVCFCTACAQVYWEHHSNSWHRKRNSICPTLHWVIPCLTCAQPVVAVHNINRPHRVSVHQHKRWWAEHDEHLRNWPFENNLIWHHYRHLIEDKIIQQLYPKEYITLLFTIGLVQASCYANQNSPLKTFVRNKLFDRNLIRIIVDLV